MTNDHDEAPDLEMYGAAALASLSPEDPGVGLRTRVAQSLVRRGRYGRFADRVARLFEIPIERAAELVAGIEDPGVFRPFMVDGIALYLVKPGDALAGAVTAFGLLTPGARFPPHEHLGDELTFVLDGGFRDDDGREIWRGEELYKPAGSGHDFVVIGDRPCIAAVVALGGVAFR